MEEQILSLEGLFICLTFNFFNFSQLRRHLLATIVQAWFLSIIWRCYGYLGDKKVARQIRDQMCSTASAFRYPENLMCSGYALMQQPPPYAVSIFL